MRALKLREQNLRTKITLIYFIDCQQQSNMSKFDKFVDMNWLHFNGLNRNNVLGYFYTSPFYDNSSNNEAIRGERIPNYAELLNKTGLEFELDTANIDEPHLYVIKKQIRKSLEKVELMECKLYLACICDVSC